MAQSTLLATLLVALVATAKQVEVAVAVLLPVASAVSDPVVLATLPDGCELAGEGLELVTFAPGGARVGFVATKGDERVPMWTADGALESGEVFTYAHAPTFSDDGEHVAFCVCEALSKSRERWSVLLDGKTQGKKDWIGSVRFWPGTADLVYWTQPGAKLGKDGFYEGGAYVLSVGKKKGKKWSNAGVQAKLVFAPDGRRGATLVSKGTSWSVLLVDRKKQDTDKAVSCFAQGLDLAADGETWALAEIRGGGGFAGDRSEGGGRPQMAWVVRRGEEKLGAEFLSADQPVFAPTGTRLAFRARGESGYGVVVEGNEASELTFGFVTEVVWEPVGAGIPAGSEGLAFVVIDGGEAKPAARGPGAGEPEGGEARVICLDGAGVKLPGGRPFLEIRDLAVAPGGASARNLGYHAKDDKGWHLVHEWMVDEQPHIHVSEVFDALGPPVYTGEGFAAGALRGRELGWVAIP